MTLISCSSGMAHPASKQSGTTGLSLYKRRLIARDFAGPLSVRERPIFDVDEKPDASSAFIFAWPTCWMGGMVWTYSIVQYRADTTMIKFPCKCGFVFEVDEKMAGEPLQCPRCMLLNEVPLLSDLKELEEDGTIRLEPVSIEEEGKREAELKRTYMPRR